MTIDPTSIINGHSVQLKNKSRDGVRGKLGISDSTLNMAEVPLNVILQHTGTSRIRQTLHGERLRVSGLQDPPHKDLG